MTSTDYTHCSEFREKFKAALQRDTWLLQFLNSMQIRILSNVHTLKSYLSETMLDNARYDWILVSGEAPPPSLNTFSFSFLHIEIIMIYRASYANYDLAILTRYQSEEALSRPVMRSVVRIETDLLSLLLASSPKPFFVHHSSLSLSRALQALCNSVSLFVSLSHLSS